MLGNFEEVRSALGQSSIGSQAYRNYEQQLELGSQALRQEALHRANQYKAEVLEKTKGRMNPAQGNSTSPWNGILADGISLAKGIYEASQGGGGLNNTFGTFGDFNRFDLETFPSFSQPVDFNMNLPADFGMNLLTP